MKRYRVRPTKTASTLTLIVVPVMLYLAWPGLGVRGGLGIFFLAAVGLIFVLNAINLFTPDGVSWPFSRTLYGYDIQEDPDGEKRG